MTVDGFVLTHAAWDRDGQILLELWATSPEGPVRVLLHPEAVMFVGRDVPARADRRRALDLTDLRGTPVDGLYFPTQAALRRERDRLRASGHAPLESDLAPAARYLMERFITGGVRIRGEATRKPRHLEFVEPTLTTCEHTPSLRVAALDLETDGIDGPILAAAVVVEGWPRQDSTDRDERAFVCGDGPQSPPVTYCADEKALLVALLAAIGELDPDVLTGWNLVEFDLTRLVERAAANSLPLRLGRGGATATVLPARSTGQLAIPRVPGRAVVDGIATLRTATWSFEHWSLGAVARDLLGRAKAIAPGVDPEEEVRRLHREDKPALAAYNLEDCRLVLDIFARTDLIGFAVQRQTLTGLLLGRQGGSVAAFDHLYLPRLHRHGHVAGDVGQSGEVVTSPGGYVLESTPGLHRNVAVFDFKSLYPSIIRTFKIDPMGLAFPGDDPIEGFIGGRFHRDRHILPELIATLWQARDQAKRAQDTAASRAIKILMNSFYGVLGTPACRFFDPRLASSVTLRGHQIITETRDWMEAQGHPVIYGDTDSLFVRLDDRTPTAAKAAAAALASAANRWWSERIATEHRVESALELQFECLYERFMLPTLRGSDKGSAKRYAGLRQTARGPEMVFRGLEAVRTDWTPIARDFQRELFRRVFQDIDYEPWIRATVAAVLRGERDPELVYQRRLRRRAEDYPEGHVPPHVRAAALQGGKPRSVAYVITTQGPQPIGKQTAPIDYPHYIERQLAPAADSLLTLLGTSFDAIAGRQLRLF